ncbi:OsmC family protein [Candidatus Bipolaricaulota bacterium]|nr:OsmC family protein [Candidatus Bipolaricaulota bacterium]
MRVSFPGGKRVQAEYRGFTVLTDQPVAAGGSGSAPSPFDLFLASIGTCAGYYVMAFCQQRHIPTDEIELTLDMVQDMEHHLIQQIDISVSLPEDFPDRYVGACVKAAEQCTVKRHLQEPPKITLHAVKR